MKRIAFVFFVLINASLLAQDPEFSQYYAAPLYLNPAFTGTTNDHRFIANYRNQWPSIANGYTTTAFSYDYNSHDLNSGFGFLATQDQAGTAGMKSTQFNFLYSYKLRVSDKWVISSGLNFGYASRSIDFNKLLFADQFQLGTNQTTPTTDPSLSSAGMAHYFDFKAGALAYNRNFWFGFAASHMNQPNRSLVHGDAFVPMKITAHGGVRIPLYRSLRKQKIPVLSPSFVYKRQANFEQLDVGAYLLYDPLIFGLWYRGIPVRKNADNSPNHDAAVVILGYRIGNNFEFVYSYDITVSSLGPASGGAHEVALKYHLPISVRQKKKQQKYLPCPSFNQNE
jgi:type IX secretion system PorP/SprF family membrane protein